MSTMCSMSNFKLGRKNAVKSLKSEIFETELFKDCRVGPYPNHESLPLQLLLVFQYRKQNELCVCEIPVITAKHNIAFYHSLRQPCSQGLS